MKVDPRRVYSHPTVLALEDPARAVLLALIRAADELGRLDPEEAMEAARVALAGRRHPTMRAVFEQLHRVRLAHRDPVAGCIVVWTPPRPITAEEVFPVTRRELAKLETEIHGPISGLTREQSEAL